MLLAPYYDLIFWLWVVAREKPEEELSCLVLLTADGEETRVALANIPCNVGKSAAIDGKS